MGYYLGSFMHFNQLINALIEYFNFRYNDDVSQSLEFYKRNLFLLIIYLLRNIFIAFFFINHFNVQHYFSILYYDTYISYLSFYYILQHVVVIFFHKVHLCQQKHKLFFFQSFLFIFLSVVVLIFSFLNFQRIFYPFLLISFILFPFPFFLMFLILSLMNMQQDLYSHLKFIRKHIYQFF